MRELDYKESWGQKNWCFWTVVLEKTVESPLDCKEIQPVHSKGDQSWVFIGRTDVEAETPILWPPDAKSWLIGKDPDAGKDWGQEEKGTTEDEMVGWYHRLSGHGFGWTLGVGDGQGGLACCSSWGCKELDMTEQLNWSRGGGRLGGWGERERERERVREKETKSITVTKLPIYSLVKNKSKCESVLVPTCHSAWASYQTECDSNLKNIFYFLYALNACHKLPGTPVKSYDLSQCWRKIYQPVDSIVTEDIFKVIMTPGNFCLTWWS